jgi:hypothetical protein
MTSSVNKMHDILYSSGKVANRHRHPYSKHDYYTITLWFQCLDGLIQTRGNVARVKKSAHEQHSQVFGSGHPNTETIK